MRDTGKKSRKAHLNGSATSAEEKNGICLGCDLDDLFCQVFSGDSSPIIPHQLLYSMWSYANHLAGYEQQDAHEFLISLLDGLHTACNGLFLQSTCSCVM